MPGTTRSSPRFALEAAIEIRAGDVVAKGRTANLSQGGFCAVVDRAVGRGSDVEVSISLVFSEDVFSEPLELPARVVWVTALGPTRHQLGAQFIRVGDDKRSFLEMFLRYLADGDAAGSGGDTDDADNGDKPISDDPFAS